jgi:hypothetical protein
VLPCVLPTCVSVLCDLPVPLAPSSVRPAWYAPHATPLARIVSRSPLCPPSACSRPGLALWPSADECASVLRAGHVPGDRGVQADNALDDEIDDDEEGPMSATPCPLVLTGDVAVATRSDAGDGPRNKRWPSWSAGWSAGWNASFLASHVASLDKPRLSRQTHPETHPDQAHPVTFALSWCASLSQLRQMHTPPDPAPPWHAGMGPSHTQHPHSSSTHACTHTTHPPTHTHTHFVSSSSLGGGKNTHAVTESYMIWPRVHSSVAACAEVTRVHTWQHARVHTSHAAACCHVCTRQLLLHVSRWRIRHRSHQTHRHQKHVSHYPLICVRRPRAPSFTLARSLVRSPA